MRNGAIIAASCVVLALGACSGGGTPVGGGPTTGEPTDGGPTDGGGTPLDSYNDAKKAVQSVLAEITEIEGLNVDTTAQKQAARVRIAAARMQYSEALAALRSAVEGFAAGSDDRAKAESYLRGVTLADIPGSLDAAALRAADVWAKVEGGGVPGFASFTAADPTYVADFTRYPRAEDDGTAIPASDSRRLSIPTDGVMHSAGKHVFSADGTGTTDELPMRSYTIRAAGRHGYQGTWAPQGTHDSNFAGALIYSAEITPTGLVYKAGGLAAYYDFLRRFNFEPNGGAWWRHPPDDNDCVPSTPACHNWVHDDIRIAFGEPSYPDDVNAFFWQTRIPLPPGTSQDEPGFVDLLKANSQIIVPGQRLDLGVYKLWISNYGGVDRGHEYADGTPHPIDDVDRFLKYAAYGVFTYTDLIVHSRTTARLQGFHFGYDTFADKDNLKTTDIASDDVVEATFRGSAFGVQSTHVNSDINLRRRPTSLNRIRGDITLNARIGSGANKISGEITRVEALGGDGVWVQFDSVLGAVGPANARTQRLVLTGKNFPAREGSGGFPSDYSAYAADIAADGSYEGGVYLQEKDNSGEWIARRGNFNSHHSTAVPDKYSIFGGTIYGPRDGDFENVETAGYWYLHGDSRVNAWGGIIGGFGAARTD